MELQRLKNKSEEELNKLKHLKGESKLEVQDDYAAAKILLNLLEEKPVSEDEIKFLRKQSIDFTKVLVLIDLQT